MSCLRSNWPFYRNFFCLVRAHGQISGEKSLVCCPLCCIGYRSASRHQPTTPELAGSTCARVLERRLLFQFVGSVDPQRIQ